MKTLFFFCTVLLAASGAHSQQLSFELTNTGYCNDPCAAGVDVSVDSAMVLPLTFEWSNGSTEEDQSGLCNGFYYVSVTDANGQVAFAEITVQTDPLFELINTVAPSCGPGTGSITVTAVNGVSPLVYLLGNDTVDAIISDIDSGSYVVTVIDSFGCTLGDTVYIPYGEPPVACFTTDVPPCTCGDSLTVNFISCSTPIDVTHNWLIGGTMQPPFGTFHQLVTFTEPGSFAAGLLVFDSLGCSDFLMLDDFVYVEPHAVYLFGEDTVEVGESALFTASTQSNYSWTLEPLQGVFTSGTDGPLFTVLFQQMFTYEVCVSTSFPTPCGGTCKVEDCKSVTVIDSTGTAVHQPVLPQHDIALSPNPARAQTVLRISSPLSVGAYVFIVDASGRVVNVVSFQPFSTSVQLDVRGIAPGMYQAVLRTADNRAVARGKLAVH